MRAADLDSFKPSHIIAPVANAGDKNEIQQNESIAGNVSIAKGFPVIFSTPRADGGKSVSRKDMNGLLNIMSQLNYFFQYMGRNPWCDISSDPINGYPKGACVWYGDTEWVSKEDDNKDQPSASSTKWVKLSTTNGIEVSSDSIDSRIRTTVNRKYITDLLEYDYILKVCTSATSGSPVSGTIYFITD